MVYIVVSFILTKFIHGIPVRILYVKRTIKIQRGGYAKSQFSCSSLKLINVELIKYKVVIKEMIDKITNRDRAFLPETITYEIN